MLTTWARKADPGNLDIAILGFTNKEFNVVGIIFKPMRCYKLIS